MRESRLPWVSGILTLLLSSDIIEEPEDDGDLFEKDGLRFEDRRGAFFKSVGRSKEVACERKKVATRWGILTVFEARRPKI